VVDQRTFSGVQLAVPTAFGLITTSWPFARISIGEQGVELIASWPLRSEWYSPLADITSVREDGHRVSFARNDGGSAYFRFWSWNHDEIVAALLECGLYVERVERVTATDMPDDP
jgi:hypothetical protein